MFDIEFRERTWKTKIRMPSLCRDNIRERLLTWKQRPDYKRHKSWKSWAYQSSQTVNW